MFLTNKIQNKAPFSSDVKQCSGKMMSCLELEQCEQLVGSSRVFHVAAAIVQGF